MRSSEIAKSAVIAISFSSSDWPGSTNHESTSTASRASSHQRQRASAFRLAATLIRKPPRSAQRCEPPSERPCKSSSASPRKEPLRTQQQDRDHQAVDDEGAEL